MFQIIASIMFFALLSAFLFYKRRNLSVQKIFFPFLYLVLYRSEYGLNLMDSAAKRLRLFIRIFGFLAIITGFLGMFFVSFMILRTFFELIFVSKVAPGVALVLPIPVEVPGILSVPFFYWIISIFILAVVHEFAHGALARVHNIHVKSTGFAFLGILIPVIPAAFVEPDEKILKKKALMQQLSVFAAGAFANIVLAAVIFALLFFFIIPSVSSNILNPAGVEIYGFSNSSAAKDAGIPLNSVITKIDGKEIKTAENFTDYMAGKRPGDKVIIYANSTFYDVKLSRNPENSSKAYLGVHVALHSEINKGFSQRYGRFTVNTILWLVGLLIWLYILNLGIGLFNLLPMGPIDGGRMLYAVLLNSMEENKAKMIFKYVSIFFFSLVLLSLVLTFLK